MRASDSCAIQNAIKLFGGGKCYSKEDNRKAHSLLNYFLYGSPNPDEPEEKRERGKVAQKGGARRHPTQVSWRDWPEGFPSLR